MYGQHGEGSISEGDFFQIGFRLGLRVLFPQKRFELERARSVLDSLIGEELVTQLQGFQFGVLAGELFSGASDALVQKVDRFFGESEAQFVHFTLAEETALATAQHFEQVFLAESGLFHVGQLFHHLGDVDA